MLQFWGGKGFREFARRQSEEADFEKLRLTLQDRLTGESIVEKVSEITGNSHNEIRQKPVGKQPLLPARAFAMYACQYYGSMSLKNIAELFGLSHPGSSSFSINKTKREIANGKWKSVVRKFEKSLYIVK